MAKDPRLDADPSAVLTARLSALDAQEDVRRGVEGDQARELVPLLLHIPVAELRMLLVRWDRLYPAALGALLRQVAAAEDASDHVALALARALSLWWPGSTNAWVDDVLVRAFARLPEPARSWVAERPEVQATLGLVPGRDFVALGPVAGQDEWPEDQPLPPADTIAGAQARLLRQGFNCGPVTGQWSERARLALQRFQFESGLPATGDLDDATVRELREIG